MMHHVHTGEAVVTSQKNDIFLLVTTRLIAHSGQSQFLRNCVGEITHALYIAYSLQGLRRL